MLCWICGADAGTREHRVKNTDLRRVFGDVSQKDPIYFSISDNKRIPVGSTRSHRLKSGSMICNDCNSRLTQPYDKSWETLSDYLATNIKRLARDQRVDLSRIFPGATKRSKIALQLYFAKLYGCIIAEHNVPINLKSFSDAIISNSAHDNLYLSFILRPDVARRRTASITEINAVCKNDVPVFANWYYRVGGIIVDVIYCDERRFMSTVRNYFHPNNGSKIMRLGTFSTNHNISRPWLK